MLRSDKHAESRSQCSCRVDCIERNRELYNMMTGANVIGCHYHFVGAITTLIERVYGTGLTD